MVISEIVPDIINWLIDKVAILGEGITSLLPKSPFIYLENMLDSDILGYLNYFLPISEAVNLIGLWVTAIITWYLYSVILRWVKAIQ